MFIIMLMTHTKPLLPCGVTLPITTVTLTCFQSSLLGIESEVAILRKALLRTSAHLKKKKIYTNVFWDSKGTFS